MSDEMREAVETAVKMELDSIDFYTDAAKRTSNKLGRLLFESLVKDEQRHLQGLRRLLEDVDLSESPEEILPARGRTFQSEIATVFSQARKDIGERIRSDADDLAALDIAMDLEKKGYRYYGQAAEKARDEMVKIIYRILQREENEHFEFLQNTYRYLDRTGDWFLWEEQGLLDGG